ncbi:cardiolipin synthase [Nannocystis pusilla]|uniref:cardiolipin synthase n=1 Tax=Nannocystis pusilla TaxID=889268 RepID=UPI003B7E7FA4
MPEVFTELWFIQLVTVLYVIGITALVLLERRRPSAALAWLLALIFLPLFGLCLYFLLGRAGVRRRRRLRARRSVNPTDVTRGLLPLETPLEELEQPLRGSSRWRSTARPRRSGGPVRSNCWPIRPRRSPPWRPRSPARPGRSTSPCTSGATTRPGGAGSTSCASARAGIEVRLLYDEFGCLGTPRELFERVVAAGGQVLTFGAVRLRYRPLMINFRNHRKIVIVDGDLGFTGGLNVGDEYLGRGLGARPWSDLQVRITGDAVVGLQAIFLEDWLAAHSDDHAEDPKFARQLADLLARPPGHSCGPMLQVVPSGPDLPFIDAIAAQFTAAIASAQERCWIATPYFVPDEPLSLALKTAALRGCDLRLLVPLPRNNDSTLVSLAGASYYDELLAAGCRIYEYLPGMLHAKYLLVDDRVAAIGSANMDVRSFYLNYEVTALFYDRRLTLDLAEVFTKELAQALEVRPEARKQLSLPRRLGEGFARLLSPLL